MITFLNWIVGESETKSQMCDPFSKLPISYSSINSTNITVHALLRGDGLSVRKEKKCLFDEMDNTMTEINTDIVRELKKANGKANI